MIQATNKDVVWSYIGTLFSVASSFLLLPLILTFLSGDEIGLWYVFVSIGGLISLFDCGFAPTFARNVAYCYSGAKKLTKEGCIYAEDDKNIDNNLMYLVIKVCKKIYIRLSIAALICAITIGTAYVYYITRDLIGGFQLTAWLIYCLAIYTNFYFGYYASIIRGVGKIYEINFATIISKIVQIMVSGILLLAGLKLIAISLGYLISSVIYRFLCIKTYSNFYRSVCNNIKKLDKQTERKEIKSLYHCLSYNAYKDGVVSISNYCATQAMTLVSSAVLNLNSTGIYSLSLQFVNVVANVSFSIVSAFHPSLQAAYIKKNIKEERIIISLCTSVSTYIYFAGILCVAIIANPIIGIINPDFKIDSVMLLLLAIYTFLWKQHSTFAAYISNTNRIPYMIPFVISSMMGIVIAITFIKLTNIGEYGLVIAPMLCQLIYNNWKWPRFVLKEINTSYFALYKIGTKEIIKKTQKVLKRA